uniref:Glucosidase 2 subunit beta n=1 Tax=Myripristis murdjan TaxID=586833 RepID=A0A667YD85_9TELE
VYIPLVIVALVVFTLCTDAWFSSKHPRFSHLCTRQFYEENKPFTCLDGSRTIPFDRVNDDYCDCQDGSDEPGTAACPNGSFHCTNAGFRSAFIPSSRVNDGICDCCDTTDEYNSGATCQNTCRELGRKERESLQKMAEIAKEGFLLKQQLIHEAKRGLEEKQAKLEELQTSKKGMEEKVEALRTVKEAAEQPEKEAKERHLKAWEEQKALIRMEKDKAKMAEVFLELDEDADGFITVAELLSHSELDPDSDGSLTETEGLLGGADKVDTVAFETVWGNIKEKYISKTQADTPAPVETPQEEVREPVPDNDSEVYCLSSSAGLILYLLFICRSLEKEISFDYGPSAEFAYLYSQCYELSTSEYIYRLCPFNRVSQKPKYGGSETSLGTWGTWAGPEANVYSVMKYEHGTGCWQGPNRSTTVKLTCGKETIVTSTSEPSRCEYLMEFTTPAVCQEPPSLDPTLHEHEEL